MCSREATGSASISYTTGCGKTNALSPQKPSFLLIMAALFRCSRMQRYEKSEVNLSFSCTILTYCIQRNFSDKPFTISSQQRNHKQQTTYPLAGFKSICALSCRTIARLCGRISPLLSADISALARRYPRPRPQISPSVSFHTPINSANGYLL